MNHKTASNLSNDIDKLLTSVNEYTEKLSNEGQSLKDHNQTVGKIVEKGFILDIPATIGWVHKYTVFPFDIDLIAGTYECSDAEIGDEIRCSILPPEASSIKGIVGMTTQENAIGATFISVPKSVSDLFDEGAHRITLLNTGNSETETRLVTSVEDEKIHIGQISEDGGGTGKPLTITFPQDTTAIILERVFGEHKLIGSCEGKMGEDAWGSSFIAEGLIVKASFYNTTTTAKKLQFIMKYFCGKKGS